MLFNKLRCVVKSYIIIPIGIKYSNEFKNKFIKYEFENILLKKLSDIFYLL